jgi:Tol biopolymer transport system component
MPSSLLVLRTLITTAGVVVFLALGGGPALGDECPNAALRAQNKSSELPECRAYEMVTPSYKEGFSFSQQGFSDDGRVAFWSTGNFADSQAGGLYNQYVASRGSGGWTTESWGPPYERYTVFFFALGAEGLSADLRSSLWTMRAPSDPDWTYYLRGPDSSFMRIGQGPIRGVNEKFPYTVGVSADLSHVVFAHGGTGAGSPAEAALYEFVGTGNHGLPRSVSVDNGGQQTSGQACFKGLSGDGRVIVFSSGCNGSDVPQLWARVGGSATVRVSESECSRTSADVGGVCNGVSQADYVGAAEDGSRVLFTTSQQLVDGDVDQTTDLYACDIPSGAPVPVGVSNSCASLTEVSAGSAPGARVESVAAVSEDGSRVYFVARGVLADNLGSNDAAAINGDFNLYLWSKDAAHPAGQTRFVTELGANDLSQPQMTPDGRYLVFGTPSALVTSGPGADTDHDAVGNPSRAMDVYRYDAHTQTMVRLSTGVSGSGGNGAFDVTINTPAKGRSATVVTADGSTVVFQTDEALSPRDVDGGPDVYSWHNGHVALISDGVGGALYPWITPSGRDIFFLTGQHLTATDGDGLADLYDARVGGGFDLRRPTPCSGDSCQGQRLTPPVLAAPSTSAASADGGGADMAPSLSLRAVSAFQRRQLAATGKLTVTVTTNTAGTVSVAAKSVVAGRSVTVGSARHTLAAAGTTTLTLTLSRKSRMELAERGKLTVKLVVSHSKVALVRSVTLRLTHLRARGRARAKSVTRSSAGRGGWA